MDFEEIERCQSSGDWDGAGEILGNAAYSLQKGGADFIIICTNTMHKVVEKIKEKLIFQSYILLMQLQKKLKEKTFKRLVCLELNIQWSKISISHVLKSMI